MYVWFGILLLEHGSSAAFDAAMVSFVVAIAPIFILYTLFKNSKSNQEKS